MDKVIEYLYEGTLDPAAWDRAMLAIADSIRASGAVLLAFNPSTGSVLRNENHRFDPEVVRDYARYWTFEDIRLKYALRLPIGQPGTEVSLAIPLKHSRIYNEFMVPVDAPHFLPVWLHKSHHKAIALSFQGSLKRGPFEYRDLETIRGLLPHLTRALEIRDRLEAAELRAANLANVLDSTTYGVFVLDEEGKILEANAIASTMLLAKSGLHQGRDGTLKMDGTNGRSPKWIIGAEAPDCAAAGPFHIPRNDRLPLSILVTPVPRANALWLSGNPAWVFLVFDVERSLPLDQDVIVKDLGLSEREAEVAALLAAGLQITEVARRMHVTVYTVRSQLKSAFQKTGCHSQAELVRRILLGPASSRLSRPPHH